MPAISLYVYIFVYNAFICYSEKAFHDSVVKRNLLVIKHRDPDALRVVSIQLHCRRRRLACYNMPLKHIEVENFKSYRGKQIIGPFNTFTSVSMYRQNCWDH